ncbi:MAG: DUF4251 domain-containing protein [Bacteroidales bacterium]|nr:DUF4251 domain-containing protein [Bacteroidales bacterium]
MKKILLLASAACLLFSTWTFAQSSRSEREQQWRAQREQRRSANLALEQQQDSIAFVQAVKALKEGSWVLEANNVNFYNGITRFVTPSTNYISYDDDEGIIQTAFSNFIYSPNGLGGVTLRGNVSGIRMSTDRDGNVYYSYVIQGSTISATVSLTLTTGTNQASANINPNFSGQTMTFDGYLVPYDQASIFQGMPQW